MTSLVRVLPVDANEAGTAGLPQELTVPRSTSLKVLRCSKAKDSEMVSVGFLSNDVDVHGRRIA